MLSVRRGSSSREDTKTVAVVHLSARSTVRASADSRVEVTAGLIGPSREPGILEMHGGLLIVSQDGDELVNIMSARTPAQAAQRLAALSSAARAAE